MLLTHEQVLSYLPHREPFLFIDTVDRVEIPENMPDVSERSARDLVGVKAIAHFEVKENLDILKGHFPGNPILPGVIQVEIMAQTSAFTSLALTDLKIDDINVDTLLLNVESAKFRKPILPGMKLEIHASMEKCRGTIATYHGEILCDGEKISEAKFMAKLVVKNKG